MSTTGSIICVLAVLTVLIPLFGSAAQGAERPIDFGRQWVRSHPYTLMGLCLLTDLDVDLYRQSGLNTGLAWRVGSEGKDLRDAMDAANLPWLGHIRAPTSAACRHEGPNQQFQDEINSYMKLYQSSCVGWILNDEPRLTFMPPTAQLIEWTRQHYPHLLAISNGFPLGVRSWQYAGDEPPRYDYDYYDYVNDYIQIVRPDVMMFDIYAFQKKGGVANVYFLNLQIVREASLKSHLPYWIFVQSYASERENRRLPSESDNRLQLFAPLTFGYTGIAYFVYDGAFPTADSQGLLQSGEKTPLFDPAAKAHREVLNIGGPIRFLTSTQVRFLKAIPSSPVPQGLRSWDKSTDREPLFRDITIDVPVTLPSDAIDQATYYADAPYLGGLIGYFHDDNGQRYFMLTNTWHGGSATAEQRELTFHIQFAPTVESIQRLNRITGKVEVIPVDPETGLVITLPGGTGDLFKFSADPFIGIE